MSELDFVTRIGLGTFCSVSAVCLGVLAGRVAAALAGFRGAFGGLGSEGRLDMAGPMLVRRNYSPFCL